MPKAQPTHRHDEFHRGIVPDDQLPPGFKTPGRDGDDGDPGPPGPPGQPGAAGSAGAAGADGMPGRPGTDGTDGDDGVSIPGPQGTQGIPGPTGQLGPPGPAGDDGDDGVGYPGAPGATGATGSTGPAGADGAAGRPGSDGSDGDDGVSIPGPQGIQGVPGPQGNFGPPGVPGDDGDDGVGYPGPAGATGATGSQGVPGVPGDDGRPGSDGNDGDDGWPLPGPQGVVGPQGQPGNFGPPGVPGEDGDDGQPGATGPAGAQGSPGSAGVAGAGGPPGSDGDDGDDGWPLPGPQGVVGPQGQPGNMGPPGVSGEDGDDGVGYPGAAGAAGVAGAAGAIGPMGPRGQADDGDDGWPGPPGTVGATGPQGAPGSGGGSGTTIIQNTEDDDGGFPRSGEPSPLVRELMQSNSTPSNNEIVRIGWSAVVEGLPLTINVGQIIEIATDGLLTLTVPGAPLHDHSSLAQGSTLRPRILNVGVPAANGSQDVTLWRETDGSLTIDKDGANAPLPGLQLRTLRLTVTNSAGGFLQTGGTAFPATTPIADDQFYRTDLDMWFFWDGTRWLSSTLYHYPMITVVTIPLAATVGGVHRTATPPLSGGSDIYVVTSFTGFLVSAGTALDASNKWVGTLNNAPAGTTLDTININSGASSTWRSNTTAVNTLLAASTNFELDTTWTKTGTPGTLYPMQTISYRIVAT